MFPLTTVSITWNTELIIGIESRRRSDHSSFLHDENRTKSTTSFIIAATSTKLEGSSRAKRLKRNLKTEEKDTQKRSTKGWKADIVVQTLPKAVWEPYNLWERITWLQVFDFQLKRIVRLLALETARGSLHCIFITDRTQNSCSLSHCLAANPHFLR